MELIVSAIMSDLLNRALSKAIQRYRRSRAQETEHKLRRLHRVLLKIDATVEEAEGRHITNQAMLRQLQMLRQGMYQGHHMLDTIRYRYSDDASGGDLPVAALPRFSSARRLLSRPFNLPVLGTALGAEISKQLEKTLDGLETLVGDTAEFTIFLEGYPRICRQPYSTHLVVGSVMFGRQMEMETVIDFLLRPDAPGNEKNPGVLPIVGAAKIGKSTLVEHVCLDERLRGHFSSIVVFTVEDLGAGDLAAFRGNAVVKHQDVAAAASHGSGSRSLAVIELAGDVDVDDETWRRLYSSAASSMGNNGKIVITSRSEKIAALGTTRALRLRALSREAYWYVFKSLVFGSANPGDQPEQLASLGMQIAELLDCSFLAGNIVASLMRANMNAEFWRRVLRCLRDYTRKHLLMFGERPSRLLQKGKSVSLWRMARAHDAVTICSVYQIPATQHDVPDVTVQDLLSGRVTSQEGSFSAVAWRSTIPPYFTYLASCASETARCSTVNKKRPRHARE
ncbi:disease resistance protein RGA2 [Sorghum bicolor]|uniref:Disease resistance N-terminal domain-containing protein n=1 Tax=Sorghum bicolor TaxID=4558 RepID=C5XID3_SORBI|nr:disease resistance protein RGA2 [Sorghum bicolor]EES01382.1 hypothetical protein SORBI_3003G279700 [Sorghum bicolor]|eukprot:XP_002456262.1 disease resistance protein RGA2 [Sorghum bicolor]